MRRTHQRLQQVAAARLERRAGEAARMKAEERFAAFFRAAPVAVLLTRIEDQVAVDVNPAYLALTGFRRDEVVGRTSLEMGVWADLAVRGRVWRELQSGRPVRGLEADFRRRDGSLRHVLLYAEVADQGGERLGVLMAQDVTELRLAHEQEREMERELHHLQRLESLGRLAGGVSHDMNNVLGAITALAESLKMTEGVPPRIHQLAETVQAAANRGRNLVRGLTAFARKTVQDPAPTDLNELVRAQAELLAHTTFRKVAFRLDLQPDLAPVLAEAGALDNLLMNLCVNACDAMPQGGTLTLETRLEDGRVLLAVADTGTGMTEEVLAKAREPFFTTKPPGQGTGLGLSIVDATVRAHGGTLAIFSAPGAGTRVEMSFPSVARSPGPAAHAPAAAPSGRRFRVLLVDDELLIRESVPVLLELLGHQAQSAPDGEAALELLRQGTAVDLVILDCNMPGLGGLATLERLRALRPDLPVLIATGAPDEATEAAVARFPAVGTLPKPFGLDELRRALEGF
jgi:PAS domain S-box-containing protein